MTDKAKNHDVFDGEIPKDIGKKKNPPVWLKLVGLVILVGLLGTAALYLETSKDYDVEPGLNLNDEVINGLSSESTESHENDILKVSNDEFVSNGYEDIESGQLDSLVSEEPENEITIISADRKNITKNDEGYSIQISDINEEVDLLSNRLKEIENRDADKITVIESGLELHEKSINKLNSLIGSLGTLKNELATLKAATLKSNKQTQVSQSDRNKNQPESIQKNQPKTRSRIDQLKLLGIDVWGGELFAQVEYKNQIHLLATNEMIGEWKVVSVSKERIMVRNQEGESFELSI